MKSYTKKYLEYFGYGVSDFIPCECCGKRATDIHHIEARSRRRDLLNSPSNLAALCRECHQKAETNKSFNEQVKEAHKLKMLRNKHDTTKRIIYE